MKRVICRCISLSIIACLVFMSISNTQVYADENGSTVQIILSPVDLSLPTISDTGDGMSALGEQAWFAFDLSAIPENAQIISVTFSAYMWNMSLVASQRNLWYSSNDSWIFNPNASLSDPGDNVIADEIVGTLWHDDSPSMGYRWKTIQVGYDGWNYDIADGYISLMLTGGQSGSVATAVDYSWGVVKSPELTLVTTQVPQPIKVTSPNGGESYQGATAQTITWNSDVTTGANVKIQLYQNCVYLRDIVSSTENDGSYTWLIPSDLSSKKTYKVKIIDADSSSSYDYSDGYFNYISPPPPPVYPPVVDTLSPIDITDTNATLEGTLVSDGYAGGDENCSWRFSFWKYGETGNVITTDWVCCVNEGETFTIFIEGLEPETAYFVRAEAENSVGSSLGDVETFITLPEVIDHSNDLPAEFDPNEINTLLIQNYVKQFQTDMNAPHTNQGLFTYVEKPGNLSVIDSNDRFYGNPSKASSKIISLVPKKGPEGNIVSFYSLSKDARPLKKDPNNILLELSIYSPESNSIYINSENALKFWLPENAFEGKPITIQKTSMDPNIVYPVWDIRNIISREDGQLPMDYLLTDANDVPADPNISFKIIKRNDPYAWFTLSTCREIIDLNDDGIIDSNDYTLLLDDMGKNGIFRSDIASLKNNTIALGIPDGKIDEVDKDAFIAEYNKKYPDNPIVTVAGLSEGFESGLLLEPFYTTGDSPWDISYDSYKGNYCLKSGNITDNQMSVLEANVGFKTGRISFVVKVSTELSYDNLIFYIDGVEVQRWSGWLNWTEVNFQTTPGNHNIKWVYEKDTSFAWGYDAIYLDEINIY